MLSESHERMLGYLAKTERWVSAGELADQLGVTTRSVRNYVTAVRENARPPVTIESSGDGYRIDSVSYADYRRDTRALSPEPDSPRDRVYHLVRQLGNAPSGLDVHDLADALFVSESTIESDLRKIKARLDDANLALSRRGSIVRLAGAEEDFRRLLSRMFRGERVHDFFELETVQREFQADNLIAFKTDLIAMLGRSGYFVNEFGTNNVLLHVAIAVDRVKHELKSGSADGAPKIPAERSAGPTPTPLLTSGLATLIRQHFDVEMSPANLDYLTLLLTTRVITPGQNETLASVVKNHVVPTDLAVVRAIVARVKEEYLVDLDDVGFTTRFSLHLGNLVSRAKDRSYSRNPLARSIKTSYPMTFEVAVFIASEIQRRKSIVINDDEIAYIALHVGSHLERQSRREERVTCAIVCANYYDLHLLLRQRIEEALGVELDVEVVITRTDIDWTGLSVDLVISATGYRPAGDNVVVVQPLPTDEDIDSIRRAVAHVRRHNRRAAIKDDLLRFFDPALFFRNLRATDEEAMIRILGERMVEHGVIDESYVEGAVERERMSSTAFTDNIAVPHAMVMSAVRTTIAIAINDVPLRWGESRVSVVALIAFSESGRSSFQRVFDQFVEVFSDRDDVQRIIAHSADFPSFIEELVHVMDS